MPNLSRRLVLGVTGAILAAGMLPAVAQTYPTRPVRLIVPFAPGGPVDTTARILGQKLSEQWGQPVIVENKAGANGALGADQAARSTPDGYTLFVNAIHHTVLPSLSQKLPYDIQKDFEPVSLAARFPVFLVSHPSVPAKNVPELIAFAKANPGKLAYASSGNGGGTHLAGELFKDMAGVDLLHVPYKGSAPAMADVIGGQVQLMFADAPTALQHVKKGTVRVYATAGQQRSALLPEVPTFAEAGTAGYEAYSWAGIMAPAGTPRDIVAAANKAVVAALNNPQVKQRLLAAGAEAAPTSPEQYGRFVQDEISKWGRIVKQAKIRID